MSKGLPSIGDVLFTTEAPLGNVAQVNFENIALAQRVIKFASNQKMENAYLLYYMLSELFQKTILKKSIGTTVQGISGKELHNILISYPEIEEQTKISNFITLLDNRIQTQNEIINHLKTQLNNLSHEIFAKKFNFTDENGNNYPEWKKNKIGKIGKILNGLSGKTKEDFGEGMPYIQYKQIFDNSKIDISRCGKVQISENENQTKFQFGDVFFTTSSETPNEIGTASVLLDEVNELYLNSFCFGFRVDETILLPEFSQYLFRSEVFRKEMVPLAQGSTRYNISKSAFVKLEINLPCIEEQRKVANFLNSISGKLETEKKLLEKLQNQKKYFLQNLFI